MPFTTTLPYGKLFLLLFGDNLSANDCYCMLISKGTKMVDTREMKLLLFELHTRVLLVVGFEMSKNKKVRKPPPPTNKPELDQRQVAPSLKNSQLLPAQHSDCRQKYKHKNPPSRSGSICIPYACIAEPFTSVIFPGLNKYRRIRNIEIYIKRSKQYRRISIPSINPKFQLLQVSRVRRRVSAWLLPTSNCHKS